MYSKFTHLVNNGPKTNLLNVRNKKPLSILPKAFSVSKEEVMTGSVLFLELHIRCNNLLMFSAEALALMNPTWSGCIIVGNKLPNLFAIFWTNIFLSTSPSEMGLQLAHC